jgi:hypothetical protein
VLPPAHKALAPEIAATVGKGFTVTTALTVVVQLNPFVTTYDIVEVPADIPNTIPDVPMVATEVVPLLHTPPGVAFESVVVPLSQTLKVPVITATVGSGLTVTITVVLLLHPKPSVTV